MTKWLKTDKPVCTVNFRKAKFVLAGIIIAAVILGFVIIKGLIV